MACDDGKGLFQRRLARDLGMCPRLVTGEHPSAHRAFAQAHRVGRQIAIGENHGERLANPVLSHIAKLPIEPDLLPHVFTRG